MFAALVPALALALVLTGCASDPPPLPAACSAGPAAVQRALAAAPGRVRLSDGTALSECVSRASDDADVQTVGLLLTPVADRLAAGATPRSALRLGFLVGAVRRGAHRSNGIHAELVRRMESRVTFDDPALLRAAERGVAAGEDHG